MYPSLALLVVAAASTYAFKDTSPFLLFSSSHLPASLHNASTSQLQSRSYALDIAKEFLADCPSEIYYILTQPSLGSTKLSSSAPHLKKATSNPGIKSRFFIAETVGLEEHDGDDLVRYVKEKCGAAPASGFAMADVLRERAAGGSIVVRGKYTALPSFNNEQLEESDASLYDQVLKQLPEGYKYTVIYTSTPQIQAAEATSLYEASFDEPIHMDLRRDLQARDHTYPNDEDVRPLFEKYSFLSPGLFMGVLVSLLLLAILSIGISAIASLEVSYGAFDKEMGPAAQKKA